MPQFDKSLMSVTNYTFNGKILIFTSKGMIGFDVDSIFWEMLNAITDRARSNNLGYVSATLRDGLYILDRDDIF